MQTRVVGLFYKHDRERSAEIADKIRSASYSGVDVRFVLGEDDGEGTYDSVWTEAFCRMEFAVSIGGDGTFLRTARVVRDLGVPLFGVNTGHLGFLAAGNPATAVEDLWQILTRQYRLMTRFPLKGQLFRNGTLLGEIYALNEVTVTKGQLARPIDLSVRAGGTDLYRFLSDGIIVSTPTGSTAYALSAGGPVIHPDVRCMLIVPICPHSLYPRPVVLGERETVEISLSGEAEDIVLSADGQLNVRLARDDVIRLTLDTERGVQVIKLDEGSYYEVLQGKLGWGGTDCRPKERSGERE